MGDNGGAILPSSPVERFAVLLALVLTPVAHAEPLLSEGLLDSPNDVRDLSGDNPPRPLGSWIGPYGIAYATGSGPSYGQPSAEPFELVDIPAGATVVAAFFVTGAWCIDATGDPSIGLFFGGANLGLFGAYDHDGFDSFPSGTYDLYSFWIDVTERVSGNGTYIYIVTRPAWPTVTDGLNEFHLVVVFEHPSLSHRTIEFLAGAESLRQGTSTAVFSGSGSGSGGLRLYVDGGDHFDSPGEESISFNGIPLVGGPGANIFDGRNGAGGTSFSYYRLSHRPVQTP